MNFRNLDHRASMTVRKRNQELITEDLKSFPQRKATMVMKFSVSCKHWVNEIFYSRKYFTYNNSMKCRFLQNSSIQCNLFPGLFSHNNWLVEEWTLHLSTKGTKVTRTIGPAQDSENTVHFNELHYQPSQLCPTFKNTAESLNLMQASSSHCFKSRKL